MYVESLERSMVLELPAIALLASNLESFFAVLAVPLT